MNRASDACQTEELRIREAYARRNKQHLYSRFNSAYLFMVQARERSILELLSSSGYSMLKDKKILEIGCGAGDLLRDFIKWGARPENIAGIELLAEGVAQAIELCPKSMEIRQGNAAKLPFPDASFDMVVQSTVFTSVLDSGMKQQMASEMCRVLTQQGLILWYDYFMNNPANPDVMGVKAREIYALFPNCEVRLQRITLAPPLARFLAPYSWLTCDLLSRIPWLCTHYIGLFSKKRSQ